MREGLAVITGTTHGIGRVTAQELARAGYRVIMLCRNEPLAREVATQIRSAIPQARIDVLACDLAHPATIRRSALVLPSPAWRYSPSQCATGVTARPYSLKTSIWPPRCGGCRWQR